MELRSENLNRMVRKREEASDGVSGGKSAHAEGPATASFLEMVVLGRVKVKIAASLPEQRASCRSVQFSSVASDS